MYDQHISGAKSLKKINVLLIALNRNILNIQPLFQGLN